MKSTALVNCIIVLALVGLLAVTTLTLPKEEAVFAPMRQGSEPKTVALTVNVYLGTEYVEAISDVLAEYSVPATFFLGGCWVVKNAETARKLVQCGHCVGSHGYSHLDHSTLDYAQNLEEMRKAHEAIKEAAGVDVKVFAPPSGAYCDATMKAAQTMGYSVSLWSKDTIDWRDQDPALLLDRATRNMASGDIILTHPTPATVQILPQLIQAYLAQGYRFVTIEEMSDSKPQ
ncbi:MAG: polysaccharide deacetylase family protein [Clostridia bacterium]|nr:polysaccharide deacetylase family protein [Clostridia bacterium]